jgi:hypothetical protein
MKALGGCCRKTENLRGIEFKAETAVCLSTNSRVHDCAETFNSCLYLSALLQMDAARDLAVEPVPGQEDVFRALTKPRRMGNQKPIAFGGFALAGGTDLPPISQFSKPLDRHLCGLQDGV